MVETPRRPAPDQTDDRPTIKAVDAYAKQLRDRVEKAWLADPDAKLYYPTTAGARQLCHRIRTALKQQYLAADKNLTDVDATLRAALDAPARAIREMATKARAAELELADGDQHSKRARQRHRRRAAEGLRDREAARQHLTVGQRLDRALAELAVVAAAPGQSWNFGDDKVSTGKSEGGMPRFPGDPAAKAQSLAISAVRAVENELEDARRRRVETEAA